MSKRSYHQDTAVKRDSKRKRTDYPAQMSSSSQSTSAHPGLSHATATSLMSAYVGSLRNNLAQHNTHYTISEVHNGFACSVTLPFNSPVASAESSGLCATKKQAKDSAAYNAIVQLIALGEFNSELKPTPANPSKKKGAAASGTAPTATAVASPTAVSANGATAAVAGILGEQVYDYLAHPAFWANSPPPRAGVPLGASLLTFSFGAPHADAANDCRPFLIITGQRLPLLATPTSNPDGTPNPLVLDFGHHEVDAAGLLTAMRDVTLTERELDVAFEYTRGLLRAIMNKPLDGTLEHTPYVLLPLHPKFPRDGKYLPADLQDVAWDEIRAVDGPLFLPFSSGNIQALQAEIEDAVITSPVELGRRFYAVRLRPDMSPSSTDPDDESRTLLEAALGRDHYEYRYRAVDQLEYPNQPLIEAEHATGPKSGGHISKLISQPQPNRLLIPEMLARHFLRASVLRAASMLPSVFSALDDELLTNELNKRLFHGSLLHPLAREALSCPAARPFPGQVNYERLEVLGDTVLKYVATMAVYAEHGFNSEGKMTHDRHLLVSNKALQAAVISAGVVPYIRSTFRRGRGFCPPGWVVDEKTVPVAGVPTTHTLGDKTVADIGEALIAAAFLSSTSSPQASLDAALAAMHTLHLPVPLQRWSDMARFSANDLNDQQVATAWVKPGAPQQSGPLTLLGYTFKDPDRGRVVLSLGAHGTRRTAFERYEFLGDALIDYFTLIHLWKSNPDLGPAPLTHMKHSRVANSTFSAFMVHADLLKHLTHVDLIIAQKLEQFTTDMRRAQAAADKKLDNGQQAPEYWTSVPGQKWLGDILEAIFGAILHDSDFALAPAAKVFDEHLRPFVDRYAIGPAAHSPHPKSALLQFFAQRGCFAWTLEKVAPDAVPARFGRAGDSKAGAEAFFSAWTGGLPVGEPVAAAVYGAVLTVHGVVVGKATAGSPPLASREACALALERLTRPGMEGIEGLCDCETAKPGA